MDEVHIYNPETNEYEPNGQPVPVPIDDHVQAVYKDSLIFCVTGWSQNTNVPNVQIYDPSKDEWLVGTSVPNSSVFKVFGSSGAIIGDTIYYAGGARIGSVFPISDQFRKGYINPIDPTEITWFTQSDPNANIYRAACSNLLDNRIIWFGGSNTTYNFDGIAYNGSGGVSPSERVLFFAPGWNAISADLIGSFSNTMDFRGVANFPMIMGNQYIFCGGMESDQKVSKKTFSRVFALSNITVSYTHLTLPTICSV